MWPSNQCAASNIHVYWGYYQKFRHYIVSNDQIPLTLEYPRHINRDVTEYIYVSPTHQHIWWAIPQFFNSMAISFGSTLTTNGTWGSSHYKGNHNLFHHIFLDGFINNWIQVLHLQNSEHDPLTWLTPPIVIFHFILKLSKFSSYCNLVCVLIQVELFSPFYVIEEPVQRDQYKTPCYIKVKYLCWHWKCVRKYLP